MTLPRKAAAGMIPLLALAAPAARADVARLTFAGELNAGDAALTYGALAPPNAPPPVSLSTPFTLPVGGNRVTFGTPDALDGPVTLFASGGTLNFPSGTDVLVTRDSNGNPTGPLAITFATPVSAFGLSAESDGRDIETFNFSVVDSAGRLTPFGTGPISNVTAPGTLAFLGAAGLNGDLIKQVIVSSTSTGDATGIDFSNDFAVGPLTFGAATVLAAPAVPEASPLALLGVGLAGALLLHARRRAA